MRSHRLSHETNAMKSELPTTPAEKANDPSLKDLVEMAEFCTDMIRIIDVMDTPENREFFAAEKLRREQRSKPTP